MSPIFGKLALIVCGTVIFGSLVIILNKIHSIKENVESDDTQPNGIVRQHGNYCVWHDYIRRQDYFRGNGSITLTTHATYMDLGMLPVLLERWQAPISLAIFACGSDFDKTIQSLRYLIDCQGLGNVMRRFISVHLVFHSEHIPKNLERFFRYLTSPPQDCAKSAPFEKMRQDQTYWRKMNLIYPVNLLRNVARMNAETCYIMALDVQLVPTPNFVKKFLNLAMYTYAYLESPHTSIFCLPTFPHKPHAPLAKSKDELRDVLLTYNITYPIFNHKELQEEWLLSEDDELRIFLSSQKMQMCVGYVSINELEPLYDERCEMESIFDRGINLKAKVLISLNYTFHILDGAFLVRHALDSWKSQDLEKAPRKIKLRLWLTWYKFYNNFVSQEPEVPETKMYRF